MSHPTQYRSFCGQPLQAKLHIDNNETQSLTFTESLTFMKHKTQKKRPKPKIVRTADYNCAYVTIMAVLIIFPVILHTVINLIISVSE